MADTLVLLRGLTRGSLHWGDFLLQVQQAFPEKTVLAIDLAGNGERFLEASPGDISAAVEDIRQQLTKAKVFPPYDVLGLSLGGMISLQWLHEYPVEIDKMVIMNTSHAGLCGTFERMRPLAMCQLMVALLMPPSLRERIIYGVTANNARNNAIVEQWIQLAIKQPVSMRNMFRQIQIARSFIRPLSRNSTQVMILASLCDRLVNVVCSKKIAEALDVEIHFHSAAGHEISLDDAVWVLENLKRYMQ